MILKNLYKIIKKEFTLIELLTVIVILVIIALITTLIILNIIKDTKYEVANKSLVRYIGVAKKSLINNELDDDVNLKRNFFLFFVLCNII